MQDFLQGNNLTSNRQYILYLKDFFAGYILYIHVTRELKDFFSAMYLKEFLLFCWLFFVFCLFNYLAIICLLKNVNTPTLKVHVPLTI